MQTPERLIHASQKTEDVGLDLSLRPTTLREYIGQKHIKQNLHIFLEAARQRNEAIDHVLLYGLPGLGKTSLAHIIAKEMGVNIRVTSGPAIEKTGDLAAILTNLEPKEILFIDEIHRLSRSVEEILYPAMEDYCLDLIIGKGPSARTVRLELPKFTLIGATTRISLLSSPLRDRFGTVYKLDFYEPEELGEIIKRSAGILGFTIHDEALRVISGRCRKTPRIANRLLRRVRDFAQVNNSDVITATLAHEALTLMAIDERGLDEVDRKLLDVLVKHFHGGPVGLATLSASIAEDVSAIEEVIEPYLLQIGFLNKTPRGRVATPHAFEYCQVRYPNQKPFISKSFDF